jgi:hypothetical protein
MLVTGSSALVSALALAAAVLAGCASHHQAAPPAGTVTKTFSAYGADGDLAVHVADVGTGSCWTTSIAAPSANAYRCIAENSILDPCFAPAQPTGPVQVACVPDPWADATVLRVTGALPDHAPPADRSRHPWAFELANGTRCVAATGTVPQINGVDLGYHCRNGANAALRADPGPEATADYAPAGSSALRTVTVSTIWRA